MDKLLEEFSHYIENKLIIVNHTTFDNKDDFESLNGHYVFTLTPFDNIRFDQPLYELFATHLKELQTKISCSVTETAIEFMAGSADETTLVNVFKDILHTYKKMKEPAQPPVAVTVIDTTEDTESETGILSPPPSPSVSTSTSQLKPSIRLITSIFSGDREEEGDYKPNDYERTFMRLQSDLETLLKNWDDRMESPKMNTLYDVRGLVSKAAQSVRNNYNAFYYPQTAVNLKDKLRPFTKIVSFFTQEQLGELEDLLNSRLNHVKQPTLLDNHQEEIAILTSAISHVEKLDPIRKIKTSPH